MIDSVTKFKNNTITKNNIPTCSICKYEFDSYYRIPRVIPKCGHTFCQKCINSGLQVKSNRKVFLCSQCHSETIIRKSAAQDIPKNIGMLDIVKNMKKLQFQQNSPISHKSPSKDSPNKLKQYCRQHPNKQLDLVCQTCNYEKVCSICALIGNNHQDHKFVEYIPATKMDLNQVKQVYTIIQDTVKQTILPEAQQNIIKRNQQNLIKMLISTVKQNFKQNYYKVIQKKQIQIINQLKQIKFDGGISKRIQQIAKEYDILKIQKVQKQNTSLEIVEEFIQKCKNLHNQIEIFSQHAQKKSKSLFKDISTKINQTLCFRINQLPFNLKHILTQQVQITSPSKHKSQNNYLQNNFIQPNNLQAKKKTVQFSSKDSGRAQRSNSRQQDDLKSLQNITFDVQRKPFTANSINTKNKSGFLPPKQKIAKSQIKKQDDLIPMLDLDSKVSQKKNSISQNKPSSNTQRLNKSSFQNIKQHKKSVQKQKSINKLNMSQITRFDGSHQEYSSANDKQPLKVKQVRPLKQVPLSMKSKYAAILKEINRQAESQSLELIGMQINDALIVYVCDYLKTKKLKYSMIKLVKNNITDQGLSILLGYLQNDDRTQVLNLTSNQLSSKCLQLLIEIGNKNNFLKTIYLSHNKVTSIAVKQKARQFENLGLDIIM